MADIKSMDRTVEKWQRQSAVSQSEYEAGVNDPKSDWAKNTAAAENAYNQGVQAAISRKAFGKGVTKAGTARWKEQTLAKGASRWSQGISLSGDAYSTGFAPYREVIAKTVLPSRGAKGDSNNIQRVAVLAKALHDKKVSIQSSS